MKSGSRSCWGLALLAGLGAMVPLLLGQGCPVAPGGLVVTVTAPSLNQTIPAGEMVTMVYSVTSSGIGTLTVIAFYDLDGIAGTGDEVTFGTGLPAGVNQFTQLSTTGLPAGAIRVGIVATNGTATSTAYAAGAISLTGGLSITFQAPTTDLTVGAGIVVPIQFTAAGGATSFNYQTFL